MQSIFRTACLFLGASTALAGCSGGGGGNRSMPPTPQYTLSTLPSGTALDLTAHQGLEVLNRSTGTPIVASPSVSFTKTAIGFDLALHPGESPWVFDTRAGSSQAIGVQHYRVISGPPGGSSLGKSSVDVVLTGGAASNLDYASYGTWLYKVNPLDGWSEIGAFATGLPTTTAQMPTSGTATYSGKVNGAVAFPGSDRTFVGDMGLNANFAANSIAGQATNIQVSDIPFGYGTPAVTGRMNDINLIGGTISGASFSGMAAAAAPQAGVTTYNIQGVAGQFGGKFYGPNAAELAGSLTMSGSMPGVTQPSVIGSFGGHK